MLMFKGLGILDCRATNGCKFVLKDSGQIPPAPLDEVWEMSPSSLPLTGIKLI